MANLQEIWKDIQGFEGMYQISSLGRAKSLPRVVPHSRWGQLTIRERILKLFNSQGYFRIALARNGKLNHCFIHRLVAETFIPNPENKECVNHLNGNTFDNNVLNLEWATRGENEKHSYSVLGKTSWLQKQTRGNSPSSRKVDQYSLGMEFIKTWDCIADAATAFGVSAPAISSCLRGLTKTSGNFIWRYH